MTVAKFNQPDFTTQDAATYKASIDASVAVLAQVAAAFAPHEAAVPDMTVVIDAGRLPQGVSVVEQGQQTSAVITAPVTDPRIDRIVVDAISGDIEILAGTESVTPSPPAIPDGKIPVCKVTLQTSTSQITNSIIDDERGPFFMGAFIRAIQNGDYISANDTGTADNYLIAPDPPIDAYRQWQKFRILALNTCTGASVLSVSGKGNRAIKRKDGTDTEADDIVGGEIFEVIDDGTNYQLVGNGTGGAPTGMVSPYAGTAAPTGWLLCDGSEISRATYAKLFTIIGTTYGVGDGSTTFNLPDLRGRIPLGKDNMGGSSANRVTATEADNLGQGAGEENHTTTLSETAAHGHGMQTSNTYGSSGFSSVRGDSSGAEGTMNTNSAGGGGSHNNMQPYITLNYIIKK